MENNRNNLAKTELKFKFIFGFDIIDFERLINLLIVITNIVKQ